MCHKMETEEITCGITEKFLELRVVIWQCFGIVCYLKRLCACVGSDCTFEPVSCVLELLE